MGMRQGNVSGGKGKGSGRKLNGSTDRWSDSEGAEGFARAECDRGNMQVSKCEMKPGGQRGYAPSWSHTLISSCGLLVGWKRKEIISARPHTSF